MLRRIKFSPTYINKIVCFLIVIVMFQDVLLSQPSTLIRENNYTPGGLMDTVFDRFGTKHAVKDLQVDLNSKTIGGGSMVSSIPSCTAGMFVVYYANGSGMESTINPLHATRRQTVCEVLSNISALLGYNSGYPNSGLVKILVDDVAPYTAPVSPSVSGVLGMATAYYVVPLNTNSSAPGIAENLIQKTIKSKADAWTNIIAPVVPLNGNGFYHGMMTFNFSNPFVNWNSGISNVASATEFDLYTVILHEITHALGFASLINQNGISAFGLSNNYYSTYDTYLTNNALVPLLTTTNSCNPKYGLTFTVNPNVLKPGCSANYTSDNTSCSSAIKYNSALIPNMPVYTPSCYEGGSSLSHFEDMCYPANTPTNNNLYFTMSNANGPGTNKRFLKQEEKNVLCDLGYTVISTYSSNATAASYTYSGGTCSTSPVWGINDGLINTGYLYTSTGGTLSIPITGTAGVINNDYQGSNPVTTITCVESVYNNGTAAVSGTNIVFTPNNTGGIFVIRYIPINASSGKGNITYIFGFVYPSFCGSVTPCDMVQNGGFENNSGCGSMPAGSSTLASCWLVTTLTPDMFVRGCTTADTIQANLGTNTYSSNIVFNSFNGAPNNAVMGIGAYSGSHDLLYSESLTNYLGAPISNNKAYTLSFWAYQFAGTKLDPQATIMGIQSFNTGSISAVLSFATDSLFIPASYSVSTYPYPPLTVIKSVTLANVFNTWRHYNYTFTTTAINTGNWLYVGMDKDLTYNNIVGAVGVSGAPKRLFYTLLDNISLRPANQAPQLNIPSKICLGQSLPDLGQYVNIIGGTFSGPGVTSSVVTGPTGTVTEYNFNATQSLTNGLYTITYTYTDNILCAQTAIQQVQIGNVFNGVKIAYASTTNCVNGGTLSVVSSTAAYNYVWQPGNFAGNVYTVAPNVITTFSVVGNNSGTCIVAGSISVVPNQAYVQLNVNPQPACPGSNSQITAIGNYTSILWSPGSYTTGVINVSPIVATSYSAMVTSVNGCTATAITIVSAGSLPNLNIVVSSPFVCPGQPSTLTANGALNYYWNIGATSSVIVVNPVVPTVYTVTGSGTANSNCASTATTMVKIFTTSVSVSSNNICAGEQVTLTAQSGANTYIWQPGNQYMGTAIVAPQTTTTYSVNATYYTSTNICTTTSTLQVIVNPCTALEETKTNGVGFILYPNPSKGMFTIESEKGGNKEIKIYGESGQMLRTVHLNESNNYKITFSDLPSGFYFVDANGKHVKFIILERGL